MQAKQALKMASTFEEVSFFALIYFKKPHEKIKKSFIFLDVWIIKQTTYIINSN